ncbi:hypothetical protein GCM10007147_32220 [Nocardiopsis kunsanensis]|uniref:DUF2157 domain-containing protein n=1 Tax=Nocardiopsis kunsanensis TaxID=141693 RepID=A0A918XG38_9ACTN|nr:hypothetical protein [Nocardiopsis kunsanensis]GHD30434.1 hypothetical protein GCM10007147_32220 [Nocardiopsis kunsanensis]
MYTHEPPLAARLRRIDRRLLVLDRRFRKLAAEREEILVRLRSAPRAQEPSAQHVASRAPADEVMPPTSPAAAYPRGTESPGSHGPHRTYGAPSVPVVPEGFAAEPHVARSAPGVYEAPGASAPHRVEADRALRGEEPSPARIAPGSSRSSGTPGAAPEVRRRSARNVILGLGAALMSVAALVFAVWAWTAADTGARVLMLLGVTGTIAWIAVPLHRRGLRATAQTLGALLAVFLAVDALLLWVLLGQDIDPVGYTAGATVVVAALLALHGRLVPLHSNVPVAVVLAQPVPVLTVVSVFPVTGSAVWLLAVVAATALADALVLRVSAPVGLRTSAVVMAALALLGLPFTLPLGPEAGWAAGAALLLAGTAGLLLAPGVPGKATEHVCAVALALAPLAASRTSHALFPGPLGWWWADSTEPLGRPATEVLRAGWEAPDTVLVALGPVLAAAVLGAVAVRFLSPGHLLPHLAAAVPLTLLPAGLLLGLSHGVFVAWTLALGTAMLLAPFRIPGHRTRALAPGGCATLVLGLWWATAVQHSLVAALVLFAVLALVCLRLAGRAPAQGSEGGQDRSVAVPRPVVSEDESAPGTTVAGVLRCCALVLWILAMAVGAVHVAVLALTLEVSPGNSTAPWWAASSVVLLCAAFGLSRGGAARPVGTALMPVTVLVAGPALAPVARLIPRPSAGPAPTVWEPAHTVLDTSVSGGAATVVAVLVAGAAALALTRHLDRRSWLLVCALTAPVTLLPLPIVLGAPFLLAVATSLAVGAGLIALPVRLGVQARARWAPVLVGTVVLLWGLVWSLASAYTTALALFTLVTGALLVLRCAVPNIRGTGVPGRDATEPDLARSLYVSAVVLWATTVTVGALHLLVLALVAETSAGWWWAAALVTLLCAAVGLCLGGVARYAGVALMPSTVLVAGPALAPLLVVGPGVHGVWAAPDPVLWAPAHDVLGTSTSEGLLTAIAVLVAAAAAWCVTWVLARDRCVVAGSLIAPAALVPVPIVLELPFLVALLTALAVGAGLTTAAALQRRYTAELWVPGLLGASVLVWAFGWSLATGPTTVVALLALAVAGAVAAALARTVPVAVTATAVATGATGGCALVVPLTLGLPVEHAALLPIALTAAVAAVAPRLRSPLSEAAEVPASLWAVIALVLAVSSGVRGELAALGLACLGVVSLCSALRPNRRFLALCGIGLMFAALWTVLASWEVTVPEAYTVPPALAATAVGWEWSRRADRSAQPSSWLAHGGGLLLLLTPSTAMAVLQDEPAWRVLAVVAVGLAVTLWGLRARLKAPLVAGGAALLVVSVRAFGTPFVDLLVELPNWLPFAVVGALLLTVGARYEASLRGLRNLRHAYAAMR